jgi:nucleoside-diphosphate-sugar epimerase
MNWTPESSNSKYGHSKYLGEMEVWRGMAEGLSAAVINPSIIIGDGIWNEGSTKIFKSVYDEFPWYTEGATGFVDARDVAAAIITLLESHVQDVRFIISGHQETYKNFFFEIADAFGKKRPHKKVTPFLAGLVWRWEKLKSTFTNVAPLVTKETTDTAFAIADFDNSKFLKTFPGFAYTPLHVTVKETAALLLKRNALT